MQEENQKHITQKEHLFYLTLHVVKEDPMDPEDQRKKQKPKQH